MRRLAVLIALALAFFAATGLARSQEDDDGESGLGDTELRNDYQTDNQAWNGLSTFAALAQGAGLSVLERRSIDWSELDSDDLVLLIYPTRFVDPARVQEFIRNGGRVLIADDFGEGGAILKKLGGKLHEPTSAESYYDNRLFAPKAKPVGSHPLAHGIRELTGNHPSAMRNLEGMESVFDFEAGASLVATGRVGHGVYVALADPSVLINRMLQFEGNLQFAINLLRFLSQPGKSDRVVILTGDVDLSGVPRNRFDDGTWQGGVSNWITDFEGWLIELNTYFWTTESLYVTTLVFAIVCCVMAFLTLPRRRHQSLTGEWTRATTTSESDLAASLIDHYDAASGRTSYLLPAAIARDNLNAALEMALRRPDPLHEMKESELLAAVKDLGGAELAGMLRELLPRVRSLPQRAQAAAHWQPRYLSRADFEALHAQSERFFEHLHRGAHAHA